MFDYVTITNHTVDDVEIRVTNDDDKGSASFFNIKQGNSLTWRRGNWQVAFVWRADNDNTESLVVKPGKTYQIK